MPLEPVTPFLKSLAMQKARFLFGLERTPDDRLNWSPGGRAPTPLQLAGKCARFLDYLAELIQTRTAPEWSATPPAPPATREEAGERLEGAFARLREVITALSEADLTQPVPTRWGEPVTVAQTLTGTANVVAYFQGQLNLIQLVYGDTDPNIPPDWGREEA